MTPDRSNKFVVETVSLDAVRAYPGSARRHRKREVERLSKSITEFDQFPILVDRAGEVIDGHAVVDAVRLLGRNTINVIRVEHLSPTQVKALRLALNRYQENGIWDREKLGVEIKSLIELDYDVELTGFEVAEVDALVSEIEIGSAEASDAVDEAPPVGDGPAVTRAGDEWLLGQHVLVQGDARDAGAYRRLLGEDRVRLTLTDPPYNVRISSVVGSGKTKYREFEMASGEMSDAEYTAFLEAAFAQMAGVMLDGALAVVFCDWKHYPNVWSAAGRAFTSQLNLAVWAKTNASNGTTWRPQHELAPIFKQGIAAHCNNVRMGQYGRYSTNLWRYAGVNTFRRGRLEELSDHATPKPVAMLADAILDVSGPKDIILDPFAGSGSTIIAAQKTGRRARAIELDLHYCDVIVRRFEKYAGKAGIHCETGLTFEEMAERRRGEVEP